MYSSSFKILITDWRIIYINARDSSFFSEFCHSGGNITNDFSSSLSLPFFFSSQKSLSLSPPPPPPAPLLSSHSSSSSSPLLSHFFSTLLPSLLPPLLHNVNKLMHILRQSGRHLHGSEVSSFRISETKILATYMTINFMSNRRQT